jgi:hypothetical protein
MVSRRIRRAMHQAAGGKRSYFGDDAIIIRAAEPQHRLEALEIHAAPTGIDIRGGGDLLFHAR